MVSPPLPEAMRPVAYETPAAEPRNRAAATTSLSAARLIPMIPLPLGPQPHHVRSTSRRRFPVPLELGNWAPISSVAATLGTEMSDICGNCGEKVPGGAQFCPHCGAWQIRDQESRASAAEAADPTTEWSWCEIEWVRSFRGSEFQARPLSPGSEQKLTRSPAFRWRRAEPPPE